MSAEAQPLVQNDPAEADQAAEPILQALPDVDEQEQAPRGVRQAAAARPEPLSWLPWLLAAVAFLFAGLWASQLGHGQQLETRLGALEGELADAREALDLYGKRMGEVRGQVGELKAGLLALESMVDEDSLPVAGGESALVR